MFSFTINRNDYKGSNDLSVRSREKMAMHLKNTSLDIYCNSKAKDYLFGGKLDN